jgi:hypothetical protein
MILGHLISIRHNDLELNMKKESIRLASHAAAAILFVCSAQQQAMAQAAAESTANPPPVPTEELPAGSEVLASGPVHEAFAKPVAMDSQAPLSVPQQPPENIQEMPPAEKPVGAGVVWVPGYWAWDVGRNGFVWVSGCWRNAPPNTYWVPGYWLQVGTQWEWIAGFWKPISSGPQQVIEYLPVPPSPMDLDPPGPPPLPNQIWVPGCWYWIQGQYVARHGYWMTQQVGWVWIPSHYAWTPRGYVFCPGHWDYDLDNRGVLFAPVYFPASVRTSVAFVYSPGICVNLGVLQLNLFTYPQYRHYYFGNYYDDVYRRDGLYPWYKCQTVHTWYDPIFVYDRWHYGQTNPRWAQDQAREFALRRANPNLRPARTYAELQTQMARTPASERPGRALVEPVKTYAASQSTPIKFERIDKAERQQIAVKDADVRQWRQQRNRWESPPASVSSATSQTSQRQSGPSQVKSEPVTHQTKWFPWESSRPAVAPPQKVRVTHAEEEVVPNPPIAAKSSGSRYIQKEPPVHPSQERSQVAHGSNSNTDLRRQNQSNNPKDSDRQR